jgi:predicted acetyltransferase/uncharacterized glyoxalase superfamily protein PhnB
MTISIAGAAPQFLVDDLARAIAFYEGTLGFTCEFVYESFYAAVSRGRATIHLKCAPQHSGTRVHRRSGEHLDAFVSVTGLSELHAELSNRGAPIRHDLTTRPWGERDFYVEDADGNILCFSEAASPPANVQRDRAAVLPLDIRQVDRSQDSVLRNLLNLYMHDMAEWFLLDPEADGRYVYATEDLWRAGAHVYFAYHGLTPIAFAIVASAAAYTPDPNVKDLEEFFVIRRHRRTGVGQALAIDLWNRYPGPWLVRVYQRNLPALPFWRGAVSTYTGGRFEETAVSVRDRPWSYIRFNSAAV